VNTSVVNAVTGTALTINNNFNGGSNIGTSGMQAFSGATVVAMTLLRSSKYSQVVQAATSTNSPWQFDEDLDGSIVIGPGGAFAIGGNITLGNTTIGLGNTATTVGNLTLTNVTIPSGTMNVTIVNHTSNIAANATFSSATMQLIPANYLIVNLNGVNVKIPYYAV
jgi:hypothetical protein